MSVTRSSHNASNIDAVLSANYKINFQPESEYGRLSIKSFPDGRLVLGNNAYIWVVAQSGDLQFKTIASQRGSTSYDFKLFKDNYVAYGHHCYLDFGVYIWDIKYQISTTNDDKDAVSKFVVGCSGAEQKNPYLVTNNKHNLELKTWNGLDFQKVSTLETEVKELSDLQMLPSGGFFYGRLNKDGAKLYSEYKFNGHDLERVWEWTVNNRYYFRNIFWVSDHQYVGATRCGEEITLWGKGLLLDGPYNLYSSVLSVQPLKNSNFVFCSTYSKLFLLQVVDNKLVFVNHVAVSRGDRFDANDFTILPNGDVAASFGNDDARWFGPSDYSVNFYRFPELKAYRDNFVYKLCRINYQLTVGLGLPVELSQEIMSYLPEMQFYKASKIFGMFRPRNSEQSSAASIETIMIPGPNG